MPHKKTDNHSIFRQAAGETFLSRLLEARPEAPSSTTVDTEIRVCGGKIHGLAHNDSGIAVYKGIPYAEPPVGALRWHAPRPVTPWSGVRDATRFGNRCWSARLPGPQPLLPESEDCLTLNVWTPAHTTDDKRPVMVWLHGGGFQFGSSAQPAYDGARLASHEVVIVTANYRLGVFGFLAHPDLDQGDTISGNFGLQDQLAALAWVQTHIDRFGGDPDNVTVFGESAGAHAIGLLMTSPLAPGLFHKAIVQSGAFWDSISGSISRKEDAQRQGKQLVDRLGNDSLSTLLDMSAETLNAATAWDGRADVAARMFAPSIDGHVIPDTPAQVFAEGRQMPIPLLAGWNGFEGAIFLSLAPPHDTPAAFDKAARTRFGDDAMPAFRPLYPATDADQAKASAQVLVGDLVIAEQTRELALRHKTSAPEAPVYIYKFDYTSDYIPQPAHTAEFPFVFGTLTPQPTAPQAPTPAVPDREMARRMMRYWTQFATLGAPNAPDDPTLPTWPAYTGAGGPVQRLGCRIESTREPDQARFDFIRTFRQADGRFPGHWSDDLE